MILRTTEDTASAQGHLSSDNQPRVGEAHLVIHLVVLILVNLIAGGIPFEGLWTCFKAHST